MNPLRWVMVAIVTLTSGGARAADTPCSAVGATVVCERGAFDALIDKMISDDAEAKKTLDLKMALSGCLSDIRDRPRVYPVVPMIFAVVGGGLVGASVMASGDGRLAGLVVGSTVISAGILLALF